MTIITQISLKDLKDPLSYIPIKTKNAFRFLGFSFKWAKGTLSDYNKEILEDHQKYIKSLASWEEFTRSTSYS